MLIRIEGVPGSGKTYLKDRLVKLGYSAYDIDEIITTAFRTLWKIGTPLSNDFWKRFDNECRSILREMHKKHDDLIVVGFNPYFEQMLPWQARYAIKMELTHDMYRRTIKRDLEIIHKNYTKIIKLLDEVSPPQFNLVCRMLFERTPFIRDYEDWLKETQSIQNGIVERGYKLMSQDDIFEKVKSLIPKYK